ncbi:MAG: YrhK family protein [Alkalibacterium sp.]|uniref:YrhK family protein n=1 Tax=Alkalibacterium sp. TaxID=1872447 RepID=UPI0039704E01
MKHKMPHKSHRPHRPQVETKKHDVDPGKDSDVIVKVGRFRLYFQNYYMIISLTNDLVTGVLYLSGSLVHAFTDLERVGMYLYIFASFFLLMRPILKITHSVFFYKEKDYREQVLGEDDEKEELSEKDKPTDGVEAKTNEVRINDEDSENGTEQNRRNR